MMLVVAVLVWGPPQAGVTGTWSGSLAFKITGEEKQAPLRAVLKQDGESLTGTAGPDADHQYRIVKGKATPGKDGLTIGFELIASGEHMVFDLKLADGLLTGKATVEGEDGKPEVATVALRPVKDPAMRE